MDIRGISYFSMVDYPGRLSAIIFCGHCNYRCPYCHNPCLVFDPASQPRVTEKELFHFLARRVGKLDGLVISGGEPTLQPDLADFALRVRAAGFKVKIDTNGSRPEVLAELHARGGVDALGIDYKCPADRYADFTRCDLPELAGQVARSIALAVGQDIPLDVRTTVHRALLTEADLRRMHLELQALGVKVWTLQQFHVVEVIDDDLAGRATWSDAELVAVARSISPEIRVRGITGRYLA